MHQLDACISPSILETQNEHIVAQRSTAIGEEENVKRNGRNTKGVVSAIPLHEVKLLPLIERRQQGHVRANSDQTQELSRPCSKEWPWSHECTFSILLVHIQRQSRTDSVPKATTCDKAMSGGPLCAFLLLACTRYESRSWMAHRPGLWDLASWVLARLYL